MARRFAPLLLVLVFACAGCGGNGSDPGAAGEPPPETPQEDPAAVTDPMGRELDLALDAASMQALLERHGEVLAAGADAEGAMAIGQGTERDYRWYTRALQQWRTMVEAATEPDTARTRLAQAGERLASLQARLAKLGDDPEKADARKQLEVEVRLTERMRDSLTTHVEAVKKLATPEVKRFVERWKPQFDKVEASSRQ